MFLRLCILFSLVLSVTCAHADTLDIGLNDDSFELAYEHPVSSDNYGMSLINGRFLYNDDDETKLGSLGFDFVGEPGNLAGFRAGAGARLYLGKTDSQIDFINLALGLRAEYTIPQLQGLGVAGQIHYAPQILSFRDSERLLESEVRLTYAILPKLTLYVKYQNIRLDIEDRSGHSTVDDGIRIGFIGSF